MDDPLAHTPPGEIIADVKRSLDAIQAIGTDLEVLPYFGPLKAAHRSRTKLRLHHFLNSIGRGEADTSPEGRARLAEELRSDAGQEMLADFADTVVRTGSRIAVAALGLLYARRDWREIDDRFRRQACEALDGISDDLVRLYLALLTDVDAILGKGRSGTPGVHPLGQGVAIDDSGPYPVLIVNRPELRERTGIEDTAAVAGVSFLIRRGLLLPDWASARMSNGLAFGIGSETRQFQQLLGEAQRLVTG